MEQILHGKAEKYWTKSNWYDA